MIRFTIDELEVLTPDQLGKLLRSEVSNASPYVKFIQDILYVGCPIDARDGRGRTALHLGAILRRLEIIKLLLSIGADVNARDNMGWTALHIGAGNGYLEITRLLLSKGADVHTKNNKGRTAWDLAIFNIKLPCRELKPK